MRAFRFFLAAILLGVLLPCASANSTVLSLNFAGQGPGYQSVSPPFGPPTLSSIYQSVNSLILVDLDAVVSGGGMQKYTYTGPTSEYSNATINVTAIDDILSVELTGHFVVATTQVDDIFKMQIGFSAGYLNSTFANALNAANVTSIAYSLSEYVQNQGHGQISVTSRGTGSVAISQNPGPIRPNQFPAGAVLTNFIAPPVSAPVPEPATCATMLMGFAGIGWAMRRKARQTMGISYA
jgi:hypothetical protein